MQETIAQIFSYIWGVWRYRWLALIVAWVVALGGWLVVRQMPEAYVASSRIYVDSKLAFVPMFTIILVSKPHFVQGNVFLIHVECMHQG